MARKDICPIEGCNRWITTRRLKQGKFTCSYHEKRKQRKGVESEK